MKSGCKYLTNHSKLLHFAEHLVHRANFHFVRFLHPVPRFPDFNGDETALRTAVWHEMTHWLWDKAGSKDAPSRLVEWRRDLEQHFRERTANDTPRKDKKHGYWYLGDHWIHTYSGKISNTEPSAQLLANPHPLELATTYMEKFAIGGLGPDRWLIINGTDSTFRMVMSILGDKK